MAGLSIDLRALEVIGYADRLGKAFVPQRVPPIFRVKTNPDRLVLPPFRIENERVAYTVDGFQSDLDRAVRRRQATRLDESFAALPDHRLWIDESFAPHYEPASIVEETLRLLANKRVREAQTALAEGRLGKAERLAQAAISADDTCLNAILVKGLVHQLRGDHDSVEILGEIAGAIAPGTDFQSWIDFFSLLVMEKRKRDVYDFAAPRASMIGEPDRPYGEDPRDDEWRGAGGHIDTEDQCSKNDIVSSIIGQYEPLSRLDFNFENEPFVM